MKKLAVELLNVFMGVIERLRAGRNITSNASGTRVLAR